MTDERKRELVQIVRGMLVGMPKKVRHGHEVTRHCYAYRGGTPRCFETHLIGHTGGRSTFMGSDEIFGENSVGEVYAKWDIHAGKYVEASVVYAMPEGVKSVDVSEIIR